MSVKKEFFSGEPAVSWELDILSTFFSLSVCAGVELILSHQKGDNSAQGYNSS